MQLTTVVAAVIERDGCVLIAQRKRTGQHPLKWEFPGGKVEPGEAPEAAVVRELEEELAIRARVERRDCALRISIFGPAADIADLLSSDGVRGRAEESGFRADRLGAARASG